MFGKASLDSLLEELRDNYELEMDWEDIQKAAHVAIARSDAGVPLEGMDSRVVELVEKHRPD